MLEDASDELLVLEIVASLGVAAVAHGERAKGLEILGRADRLSRVAGETTTVLPKELSPLAVQLGVADGDYIGVWPVIGTTAALAAEALSLAAEWSALHS
jgi:hypothetical protein